MCSLDHVLILGFTSVVLWFGVTAPATPLCLEDEHQWWQKKSHGGTGSLLLGFAHEGLAVWEPHVDPAGSQGSTKLSRHISSFSLVAAGLLSQQLEVAVVVGEGKHGNAALLEDTQAARLTVFHPQTPTQECHCEQHGAGVGLPPRVGKSSAGRKVSAEWRQAQHKAVNPLFIEDWCERQKGLSMFGLGRHH